MTGNNGSCVPRTRNAPSLSLLVAVVSLSPGVTQEGKQLWRAESTELYSSLGASSPLGTGLGSPSQLSRGSFPGSCRLRPLSRPQTLAHSSLQ